MSTPANSVRFHQEGATATFKVEGRATMHQSSALRRQAELCIATGALHIRVDLSECLYMDSTFLGSLIVLHKQLDERQGSLLLLAPSVSCSKLLRQMGLHDYLREAPHAARPQATWVDLSVGAVDSQAFRRTVEQAHQELARLPGETGEQFQAALRCLNQATPAAPEKPEKP